MLWVRSVGGQSWGIYRNDGAGSFNSVAMHDDGTNGDLVAGNGIWSGVLPPQPDKTIVEFYVSASDGTLTRTLPTPSDDSGGHAANALYQVDNTVYGGTQPIYRFIMTDAERAELADIGNGGPSADQNSDAQMSATFIAIDGVDTEVRYSGGIRNRGLARPPSADREGPLPRATNPSRTSDRRTPDA